jgi:hypothetical protein
MRGLGAHRREHEARGLRTAAAAAVAAHQQPKEPGGAGILLNSDDRAAVQLEVDAPRLGRKEAHADVGVNEKDAERGPRRVRQRPGR